MAYETPQITELGSVAEFTRGDNFAWKFDGMSLAEAVTHVITQVNQGVDVDVAVSGVLGTS